MRDGRGLGSERQRHSLSGGGAQPVGGLGLRLGHLHVARRRRHGRGALGALGSLEVAHVIGGLADLVRVGVGPADAGLEDELTRLGLAVVLVLEGRQDHGGEGRESGVDAVALGAETEEALEVGGVVQVTEAGVRRGAGGMYRSHWEWWLTAPPFYILLAITVNSQSVIFFRSTPLTSDHLLAIIGVQSVTNPTGLTPTSTMTNRTTLRNAARRGDADALDLLLATAYEQGEADALEGAPFCEVGHDARTLEAYREGYEAIRFIATPDAATVGAASPSEHRAEAIAEDAGTVLRHLTDIGVTFDAQQKLRGAEEFSYLRGGSTLAIPSKLAGVTAFQGDVSAVRDVLGTDTPTAYYPCRLFKGTDAHGAPEIVVMAETKPGHGPSLRALGTLQAKHAAWLAPVLETNADGVVTTDSSPVRVYVTAITGGTPERPTMGVNVAITGTAQAIRRHVDALARAEQERRAFESGNVVAMEAA